MTASTWVKSLSMPKKTQTAILHTRFWTQGEPSRNENNHPIQSGTIVGVHNGSIWNDDSLFAKTQAPRRAEVDSEAIFAALAYGHEALNANHDIGVLEHVYGAAAIAYIDQLDEPGQLHLARLSSSPLCVAQTQAGSLVFGSEMQPILDAMEQVGLEPIYMEELEEGTYLRVVDGIVKETRYFEYDQLASARRRYSTTGYGSYGAGRLAWAWDEYEDAWPGTTSTASEDKKTPVPFIPAQNFRNVNLSGGMDGFCIQHDDWSENCGCEDIDTELKELMESGAHIIGTPEDSSDPLRDSDVAVEFLYMEGTVMEPSSAVFYERYKQRVSAYRSWLSNMARSTLTETQILAAAKANNLWTRPGDWVNVQLNGADLAGQVVEVPDRFPGGDYLLRVLVPKDPKRGEGMEPVLLIRKGTGFTPCRAEDAWVGAHLAYHREGLSERPTITTSNTTSEPSKALVLVEN